MILEELENEWEKMGLRRVPLLPNQPRYSPIYGGFDFSFPPDPAPDGFSYLLGSDGAYLQSSGSFLYGIN